MFGIGSVVAVGVAIAILWRPRPAESAGTAGLTTRLAVERFALGEPPPQAWAREAFADSLAATLARMPGLAATVSTGSEPTAGYVLRGDVTSQQGRMVIAARLYAARESKAVWTATLWRKDARDSNIVKDLAADVAEALYGQLARRAMTTTREER